MRLTPNIFILFCLFAGSFQQRFRPSTTQPPERSPSKLEECGAYDLESFRIYNGDVAQFYDHPWYALLEINIRGQPLRCGGSIINPLFVVSAAHCFDKLTHQDLKSPPVKVIFGEHDTEKNPECLEDDPSICNNIIEMDIVRITIHSDYIGSRGSFVNDIALLELKWSMGFKNQNVLMKPICLPIDEDIKDMNLIDKLMTVTGFGRTEKADGLSKIKRKVDLEVISTEECQGYFDRTQFQLKKNSATIPIKINETAHLCAKGSKKEDTCNGDSGGPFVLDDKYLMGIVSFGHEDCGTGDFPAIFTRVSSYVDWIVENMKQKRRY